MSWSWVILMDDSSGRRAFLRTNPSHAGADECPQAELSFLVPFSKFEITKTFSRLCVGGLRGLRHSLRAFFSAFSGDMLDCSFDHDLKLVKAHLAPG